DVPPLIDIALGDVASHFVVRDPGELDAALVARSSPLSGRVSFLAIARTDSSAEPGDPATADQWVTCENPELGGLPRQLLGRTLIVADLAAARRHAAESRFAGYRFVTRAGELVHPDGTLTVGPHRPEAGILSRKSELRELRAQAENLNSEIAQTEARIADLRDRADGLTGPIHGLEEE